MGTRLPGAGSDAAGERPLLAVSLRDEPNAAMPALVVRWQPDAVSSLLEPLIRQLAQAIAREGLGTSGTAPAPAIVTPGENVALADTMSVPEAGARLGMKPSMAYLAAQRGDFPVITMGRRKRVSVKAFEAWLEKGGSTGP
ncbi:MAG: helix-turn-helix domain-containing protein [Gemmataceae bacterium]|nr:helix-turn-helix domain-containing protein [Gemmataceae bacterium]